MPQSPSQLRLAALVLALLATAVCVLVLRFRLRARTRLLAENQAQLQSVLDSMTDGVLVLDQDRKVVFINVAAERDLNAGSDRASYPLLQEQIQVLSAAGEVLPFDRWLSARAVRGDFVQNELVTVLNKATGESHLRHVSTAPVAPVSASRFSVSKPHFILTFRDDSDRRIIDETRARLALIVEYSNDAIIGKDAKGLVTSWNRGAEKIFGFTAAEMIGSSIRRLIPEDRLDEGDNILARILHGETVDHFETIRLTKDRRAIHVSLTVSPIRDAAGHVIGASKIARDVTETWNLERQLRQSQKMEALGQLTGGIAHDFNNLLGIIIGNLDLLESLAADTPAFLKHTRTAQRAALRASDLTRRLLAFSSHEHLKPAPTHIHHSIHDMMEMASRALGPEVRISTELDESLPPVLVDPAGLESAILNLVVNARDAMPTGGALRIATRLAELDEHNAPVRAGAVKPGCYACVSISDNGKGMSQETLERAFEPFFSTKPRGRGTGLGLAMVYGFLKQSNGTARIYSEPGYGTTVSLYLPFAHAAATVIVPAPAAPRAVRSGGTVLLVDDEADLLDIAVTFLQHIGYRPLSARDGASALRLFEENPNVDVMVTDIIMPGGMNGVELAARVSQVSPSTRIAYTSGFPADALAEKSFSLGDKRLLHKPYRLTELQALILLEMEPALEAAADPAPDAVSDPTPSVAPAA